MFEHHLRQTASGTPVCVMPTHAKGLCVNKLPHQVDRICGNGAHRPAAIGHLQPCAAGPAACSTHGAQWEG